MLGGAITTIEYAQADLTVPAALTDCVDPVAAALRCGFRLIPTGNFEDAVTGPDRLQNFRHAKRAQLSRALRWHFHTHHRVVLGERMGTREFFLRWAEDRAFRTALESHPGHSKWRAAVRRQLATQPLVAVARDRERTAVCPLGGSVDPEKAAAFARMMDEGVG